MNTQKNIDLLTDLGSYLMGKEADLQLAKERARVDNQWFTTEFIDIAIGNIAFEFLQRDQLEVWMALYNPVTVQKTIGIVMAGNIPLVGFHDFLCGFMSGHRMMIKPSSKDSALITFIVRKLCEWDPTLTDQIIIAEQLKNCDAYIATGSNNSSRYFEQYFGKYPHIIRKNRTSVAILKGDESVEDLEMLADDVFMYFGLGCRNVTQVCVPHGYDFLPMLEAFKKYGYLSDHNKYRNNFDYHLAIYLLNKVTYMTNDTVLLVENNIPFSAVSVLHYRYYQDIHELETELLANNDIQALAGDGFMPLGQLQQPHLWDYADGVDTMKFLCEL